MNRIANFHDEDFMKLEKEINNWLKGTNPKVISISYEISTAQDYYSHHYVIILYELEP